MAWEKVVLDERRETKDERKRHPEQREGSRTILSDVCEFIVDCPHTTANDEGVGFPLVRTPNVGKGRLVYNDMHRVSEDVYNLRNARAVPQEDDLIFAREAPAGNVALIRRDEKVCLGQRTVLLRPNKQKVDPSFLTYFLLAPKQQYGLTGTANGATVAHVNLPTIRNLAIELPDITVQRKIGKILSAYDDLIENNQKQIKLLEEAAQRLYKQWFIDLKFPGHESTKIVDGLPEGWKYRNVSDFGSVITGKTPSTSKKDFYGGDIPFVTIPDMHGNVFSFETEKYLTSMGADSQKTKFLPKNAVMVSCIATVGLVNIVAKECQTNQQINSVILKEGTDVYFFYESMLLMKSLLDGVGSNGATMTNVNKSKFENVRVLYPTKNLVMKFHEFTHPLFLKILSLSKSIHELKLIRDRLLPKLMSGEIEV